MRTQKHIKHRQRCCAGTAENTPCDKPEFSFGRCAEHYRQWLKHESPSEIERMRGLNFAQRQAEYHRLRMIPPTPRPWEFEPSPEQTAELIEKYGR